MHKHDIGQATGRDRGKRAGRGEMREEAMNEPCWGSFSFPLEKNGEMREE